MSELSAEEQANSQSAEEAVLAVKDLSVTFDTPDGPVEAVKNVSWHVGSGEVLGIVGESGSGKSQSVLAAMGLLASNGQIKGSITYRGEELVGVAAKKLNKVRGSKMTMIFQDPLTSLTPHIRVGKQITEVLVEHKGLTQEAAEASALEMLERVRITEARRRMAQYPHELSGGMRQRIMIAMALVTEPDLLIADEPTTALDVTVQAQVLEMLRELQSDLGTAVVLITHDMGVVAGMCDRIEVMRYGEVVEQGTTRHVFYNPEHDYTKMLINSMPRIDSPNTDLPTVDVGANGHLLDVDDLKVHFPVRVGSTALVLPKMKPLRAVDGVSFKLHKGETLGIVGESGCGKSTLARGIIRLVQTTEGQVVWMGKPLSGLSERQVRSMRDEFQIVFQDPLASLDPRMTIGESIAEPLKVHRKSLTKAEVRAEVADMMNRVGLEPAWINRYPHELSGGQNQRVGIARAMILKPKLVICDEAVSALDVSIQHQIIDLLIDLQRQFELSMLFISHDLSVVRQISHRVMVLFLGRIVELAGRDDIYNDPRHPYTKALISAVPVPDPDVERSKKRIKLDGELPSPLDTRSSLMFLKSKVVDDPDAEQYRPKLIEVSPDHWVAEHDPVT